MIRMTPITGLFRKKLVLIFYFFALQDKHNTSTLSIQITQNTLNLLTMKMLVNYIKHNLICRWKSL